MAWRGPAGRVRAVAWDAAGNAGRPFANGALGGHRSSVYRRRSGLSGLTRDHSRQMHNPPSARCGAPSAGRSRQSFHREPFLLLDEVLELEPGRRVVARARCAPRTRGSPAFPGRPVMRAC